MGARVEFSGQGVVVTGAGRGIGAGIAELFVERGAAVILMDVDIDETSRTAERLGPQAIPMPGDVTSRDDLRAAIAACERHAGRLDVFVANAGVSGSAPLLDVDDDAWDRIMRVNVTGLFRGVQEAGRSMRAGGGGRIVVTASTNATQVEENLVPYSTSKGAVVTFVRAAALDLARHGIRINAVAPGVVDTRVARWVIDDPVLGPAYLRRIPLGRFAATSDVARAVAFLASDESAYITGQTLILDGGQTLGIPYEPQE